LRVASGRGGSLGIEDGQPWASIDWRVVEVVDCRACQDG
jgi:hypothetical protein